MDVIAIGRISKPIGTRGEVKVLPLTHDHQRFENLAAVWIGSTAANVELKKILAVRIDAKQVVLALDGVETMEAAEQLKDSYLFVSKEDAVPPEQGSYFVDDVLGSEVVTEEQTRVGTVTDLLSLPMNDVWVVQNGTKEILIPAVKAIVRQVDVEKKRITIHAFEGLLD